MPEDSTQASSDRSVTEPFSKLSILASLSNAASSHSISSMQRQTIWLISMINLIFDISKITKDGWDISGSWCQPITFGHSQQSLKIKAAKFENKNESLFHQGQPGTTKGNNTDICHLYSLKGTDNGISHFCFPLIDTEGSPVFILGTVLYKTLGLMLPSPK